MSVAVRYLPSYSVADYRQWPGDWELWDGVAIAMTPSPFWQHGAVIVELLGQLRDALQHQQPGEFILLTEIDWPISNDTVVRPDIALCRPAPRGQFIDAAPLLVVEVLSQATHHRDLTVKSDLYAANAVQNYLIVDPAARRLELRQWHNGGYVTAPDPTRLQLTERLTIALEIPKLWPPAE